MQDFYYCQIFSKIFFFDIKQSASLHRLKSTLGRQVLTPVRRSGRIDKYESMLPPVVRSHVQTASSPGQFAKNIENGDVCFLPNPNVQSEWNDIWAMKDGDKDSQDRSF